MNSPISLTQTAARPVTPPAGAAGTSPGWLRGATWQLRHRAGLPIADALIFLAEGFVWSGEAVLWRWHYADARLTIAALDGTGFMEFPSRQMRGNLPLDLSGRLVSSASDELDMVLAPVAELPKLADAPGDFNASVVLGSGGDGLLVILNSAHRPFDGREYGPQWRWEFADLPERIGVDHVRLAEGAEPLNWYTNKTRRIMALLEGIIRTGYRQVVLCGMSSGGYGAMLFGEMLGRACPDVMVRTSTINPQTGHAAAHRRHVAAMDPELRPVVMTDAAYAMRDCAETEIDALARGPRRRSKGHAEGGRVSHTIYYDSGNPAERYYVEPLGSLAHVVLRPFGFGVGHMSGCLALYERRLVQNEVERHCRATAGLAPDARRPT